MGRLPLSVGCEVEKMVLNKDFWLFHLALNFLLLSIQCRPCHSVASDLGLHCLPLFQMSQSRFTDNPLSTAPWRHSDKNSAAIKKRYLDFITLVNDNQVDNYLKEFLASVYYGEIVNNRPKKMNHPDFLSILHYNVRRSECSTVKYTWRYILDQK